MDGRCPDPGQRPRR